MTKLQKAQWTIRKRLPVQLCVVAREGWVQFLCVCSAATWHSSWRWTGHRYWPSTIITMRIILWIVMSTLKGLKVKPLQSYLSEQTKFQFCPHPLHLLERIFDAAQIPLIPLSGEQYRQYQWVRRFTQTFEMPENSNGNSVSTRGRIVDHAQMINKNFDMNYKYRSLAW